MLCLFVCSISITAEIRLMKNKQKILGLPPHSHVYNLTVCRQKKINFKMKYCKIFSPHAKNAWIGKKHLLRKIFQIKRKKNYAKTLSDGEEVVEHALGIFLS
jgi:hypothetical protein